MADRALVAKGLAETLREAIAQRDRWPAYGEAGRRLLEDVFDWRVIQGRFNALYASLRAADLSASDGLDQCPGRG